MRAVLMGLVALIALAAAPLQAADLTVATFNTEFLTRPKVHAKFGFDLNFKKQAEAKEIWNQPGYRDQKFAEAAGHVAKVIATINADVITLTEVGDEKDVTELRDAVQALGVTYPYMAVCDCSDGATQQHVAVVSRFKLTGILPSIPGREGYFKEPDDPDSEDDTAISKGLSVEFTADGHLIHLYVLHLISERGGYEADAQRVAQASIARRHMLPLLAGDAPVIVTGDLNDGRGQPAVLRLRGFDDIYPDLMQTGLAQYFAKDEVDTRWTYSYQGERNQIDHVLLSPGAVALTRSSKGIRTHVVDHGDPLASDHRAMVVTLALK